MANPALYLALVPGKYVGWGVCSTYLIQEVGKLIPTAVINGDAVAALKGKLLKAPVFHTIGDHNLTKVMPLRGTENYGYTFFENVLPAQAKQNAADFDLVLAGSGWCRDRLIENGIKHTDTLIQGIDPKLFSPLEGEKAGAREFFVIFSGGKFELRKGQDVVIKAVAVMQQRHADVMFVNCWHNSWAFSFNTMAQSALIKFAPQSKWSSAYLQRLLAENGIDLQRTETLPRLSQDQLRKIYACTDVGLFPNRCEGGTNLVMMEYMACAKPVVASLNSGHLDVLTESNCLGLKRMQPMELYDDQNAIQARWYDPDVEEVIERLEYAYQHRAEIGDRGQQAGRDMARFTWADTARDLVRKLRVG